MQITKLESVNDVDKLVDRLFGMRNQVEKRKYAKKQLHKIFREADGPVYVLIDDGSPDEGWAFPPRSEGHGGGYGYGGGSGH